MAQLDDVHSLLEAFRRRDTAALQALASQGIDLETRDHQGCTVLLRAAESGEPGTVQWILEAGAAIDATAGGTMAGQDALMRAAAAGRGAVVDLLLAAGADPSAHDAVGQRAIDLAHRAGHQAIVERLRAVSGDAPRPQPVDRSEAASSGGLSQVDDRGLGRYDGEDLCILVRASPAEVAALWQERIQAAVWHRDAYGADVQLDGRCYLVFRFRSHDWTILRAVHESPDPGFDAADAAFLSQRLHTGSVFLSHSAGTQRLHYGYFLDGRRQMSMHVPGQLSGPLCDSNAAAGVFGDGFKDSFGDEFDDSFDDSAWPATSVSWPRALRQVDAHLRRLDAYAPSWGRLKGATQRLEVAGLEAVAFERMDFLACG